MINETEIWGEIAGYPSYLISNYGRVKSLKKVIDHRCYKEISEERIITNKKQNHGYLSVTLSCNGKKKMFLIHRLVALSFIENTENKKQVNHKNGVRTDNRLENLEWVSVSENHIHAFRVLNKQHPRHRLGKKGVLCKHSIGVYCPTLQLYFPTIRQAGEDLGVRNRYISDIIKNKRTHIHGLTFREFKNN